MKRIAITMGEPGGVGPEVALKAVASLVGEITPVLVGDPLVFEDVVECLRKEGAFLPFSLGEEVKIEAACDASGFIKGKPTEAGGRASVEAIKHAVQMVTEGKADAIATAPISKEAMHMAGHEWPGHTELLAELTSTSDYAMMLVGGGLRVMLVTIHTPLKNVPELITHNSVLKTIRLSSKACALLGIKNPRIAVAGLNPHAGEGGIFGVEEERAIIPAIEAARDEGVPVTGPYPADSLFYRAHRGEFDLIVAMYHDQGLVPLKLLGFETGVNITVGLPIVRTSPDHGTAYDIAWGCTADPGSMIEAIKLAAFI